MSFFECSGCGGIPGVTGCGCPKETGVARQELLSNIKAAEESLAAAQSALQEFNKKAENNVFQSLEGAKSHLYDQFGEAAFLDCQGRGNVGSLSYHQEFMVEGEKYKATCHFEYDRHDRAYHYVSSQSDVFIEKLA